MGNKHSHINLPPPLPPPPKPHINMDALQKAVGIIGGVIALSPIGKLVETGIMTVADIASNGKASEFVNNGHEVNRTMNLLPGGMLAQQLLNDASKGEAGSTLSKFIPDPMKMVIHDTVKIGETIVLHPSQTLDVGKNIGISDVHNLHNIIHNYQDVVIKTKPTMHQYMSSMDHPIIKSIVPHLVPKHIAPMITHLPTIFHISHTETHPIIPPPVHIIDHPIIESVVPQLVPNQADPIITPLPAIFSIPPSETHPIIPVHTEIVPSPISIPLLCLGALCLGAFMSR